MQFNTGDCEGIFAIYSKSVVSILSFLLYLLQDLIFNGNQIDFAHPQLFWTRRIAITSASASNLLQINERLINKMIFLSLSALSSYIEENNIGAFNTYHVKYSLHGQRWAGVWSCSSYTGSPCPKKLTLRQVSLCGTHVQRLWTAGAAPVTCSSTLSPHPSVHSAPSTELA